MRRVKASSEVNVVVIVADPRPGVHLASYFAYEGCITLLFDLHSGTTGRLVRPLSRGSFISFQCLGRPVYLARSVELRKL
jgi:hypothetical protein